MNLRTIRYVIWGLVAIAAGLFGLLASGLLPDRAVLPGAASVGAPFELVAHTGERFSSQKLLGKPFALFFGFTQCPDVCPTTLLEVTNNIVALGDKADRLNVVFITVDPERDTAEHLAAYLKNFDQRIIGLTGTPEEIAAVAKSYRVFYQKVATSGGYTLNHTATVYLMDAKGGFFGTLSFQEPEQTQKAKLARLVGG